jgi:hypothetical protein
MTAKKKTPAEPALNAKDQADLDLLGTTETQELRTLLEIWSHVLSNIETERTLKITPQAAFGLVSAWPILKLEDIPVYLHHYYDNLLTMREILHDEISKDPLAFEHTGKDEKSDAIMNRDRYVNLLRRWQEQVIIWEADWTVSDTHAGAKLAAMNDATAFYVSSQGLVENLDQIGFSLQDEERDEIQEGLNAFKQEYLTRTVEL